MPPGRSNTRALFDWQLSHLPCTPIAFPLVWCSGTKEIPLLIGQTTPSDDWIATEFCSKHHSDTLIAGSFQALSVISSSPEQRAVEEFFDCLFLIKKFAMPLTGPECSICKFLSSYACIFETILDISTCTYVKSFLLDWLRAFPQSCWAICSNSNALDL